MFRAVLREVTLNIPRGCVTALVGHSGAGKSTVAALVSRFYEPSEGDILLGGSSVKGFTRGEWAKAVALVSQEPVLFSGKGYHSLCSFDSHEFPPCLCPRARPCAQD